MDTIIAHLPELLNQLFSGFLSHGHFSMPRVSNPDWEASFTAGASTAFQQLFVQLLTHLDQAFFQSIERRSAYLSKGKRSRTIVFSFGTISFERYRYFNRFTGEPFYYIDWLFRLSRYQRLSDQVVAEMLKAISQDHDTYQRAAARFGCSKTTVYHKLKQLDPDLVPCYPDRHIEANSLHCVADEDHVPLQGEKKANEMLKHVTLYTHRQAVCKGRNKLMNRIIFAQQEHESLSDFTQRIDQYIEQHYPMNQRTVFVYGDGASWIQTLSQNLSATFILDKFHMKQALFRICGGRTKQGLRNILENYLEHDAKELFETVCEQLLDKNNERLQNNYRYIQRHWESYQRNKNLAGIECCCAEGINSHYFADRLSSRPRGFCKENLYKLGNLLAMAHSGMDIGQYYLQNKEALLKKPKKEQRTSQQRSKGNEVAANLPALQHSLSKPFRYALHQMAHGCESALK